ncbi:MAG TPA: hypothetical protein VF403_21630 [Kofleriaceae bacterium]
MHAGDVIVVFVTWAIPVSQVLRVYYLPTGNLIENETVRTSGAYTMTAAEAPPDDWVFDIVAFKAL